jgi:hypothetical protein
MLTAARRVTAAAVAVFFITIFETPYGFVERLAAQFVRVKKMKLV